MVSQVIFKVCTMERVFSGCRCRSIGRLMQLCQSQSPKEGITSRLIQRRQICDFNVEIVAKEPQPQPQPKTGTTIPMKEIIKGTLKRQSMIELKSLEVA